MKKRKNYTVDTTSGSVIFEGKSDFTKNMLLQNGMATKRNGWKNLYNFRDYVYKPYAINGIYEYKGKDKARLIIHADTHMYECSYDLRQISEIPCAEGVSITNKRTCGEMYGGLLWIGGMGQLLIYDGQSIRLAHQCDNHYVPVTSVEITDFYVHIDPVKHEAPNLLTRRRINSLRGVKNIAGIHKFILDANAREGCPFRIKAYFRVKKSDDEDDDYTSMYVGKDEHGEEINAVVYAELYTDCLTKDEIVLVQNPVNVHGETITMSVPKFSARVSNGKELYLFFDAVSYQPNTDNIIVEFTEDREASNELDGIEAITKITLKNGDGVMAFSAGENKVYFNSYQDGKFYVPQDKVVPAGAEVEKITALLPMSQSTLGIYKENGFCAIQLEGEREWKLFSGSDIQGCVNPFVAARLGSECLSLCIDGVFGVKDFQGGDYISTVLKRKSGSVQLLIDKTPVPILENATACVSKDKYYLFLGDYVYVAEQRENGEYTWWMLDSCPARSCASINGVIYMGRENGDVAIFDQGYKDCDDYVLTERERDFLFNYQSPTSVSFNYAIGVKDEDKISMEEHYVLFADCFYDKKTNLIHIPKDKSFRNELYIGPGIGDYVRLIDEAGYLVYEGELLDYSPSELVVYCGNLGLGESTGVSLYLKKDEKTEYTIKMIDGEYRLLLEGQAVTLYNSEIDRVYIRKEREIECGLYTDITDLGTVEGKSLLEMNLTVSRNTRCNLEVGYETGIGSFSKSVILGSYLDFGSFDFNDVAFASRLKNLLRIRCFERSFDYIRFFVRSKSGKALEIDSLSLTYKE